MKVTAEADDVGLRLDVWLSRRLPDISRTRVKSLITGGHVSSDAGAPTLSAGLGSGSGDATSAGGGFSALEGSGTSDWAAAGTPPRMTMRPAKQIEPRLMASTPSFPVEPIEPLGLRG